MCWEMDSLQNVLWRSTTTYCKTSMRQQISLITYWIDRNHLLWCYELLPQEQTIFTQIYSDEIDQVNEILHEQQFGFLNCKGVFFLQDIVRLHTSQHTLEAIESLEWESLVQSLHSPYLSPITERGWQHTDNSLSKGCVMPTAEIKFYVLWVSSNK